MHRLETRDLALNTSMIPLGSCTMKLNATVEMIPITWPEFNGLHPFAPLEQAEGYCALFNQLESWLAEITGLAAVSLQPNAGSQGEYSGLLVIRKYHQKRGEADRKVCLIPESAHGTNPASALMAGLRLDVVKCDPDGNIDVPDLQAQKRELFLKVQKPLVQAGIDQYIPDVPSHQIAMASFGRASQEINPSLNLFNFCLHLFPFRNFVLPAQWFP
jgi:glycine cleavage system protein P-like pyridoxal-binding family